MRNGPISISPATIVGSTKLMSAHCFSGATLSPGVAIAPTPNTPTSISTRTMKRIFMGPSSKKTVDGNPSQRADVSTKTQCVCRGRSFAPLGSMPLPPLEHIVYGPIQSRRLGRSLGINLLPAGMKVCNMNCAYCQYGWTRGAIRYRGQGASWPGSDLIEAALALRLQRAAECGEL